MGPTGPLTWRSVNGTGLERPERVSKPQTEQTQTRPVWDCHRTADHLTPLECLGNTRLTNTSHGGWMGPEDHFPSHEALTEFLVPLPPAVVCAPECRFSGGVLI